MYYIGSLSSIVAIYPRPLRPCFQTWQGYHPKRSRSSSSASAITAPQTMPGRHRPSFPGKIACRKVVTASRGIPEACPTCALLILPLPTSKARSYSAGSSGLSLPLPPNAHGILLDSDGCSMLALTWPVVPMVGARRSFPSMMPARPLAWR